jgi:Leucine-rich repeat (LRR) protein
MTLTFHQDDVPSLKELDVLSFIRRVKTVVFEGDERMVIEAKHSGTTGESSGSSQWHYGMADPNVWAWEQPTSLREIFNSDTVTAVKSLHLSERTAFVVFELSWYVFGGDKNWTTTKTSGLLSVQRGDVSAEEILLNPKLRNIQTLKLSECDRSVLVNVSTLANLESLNLRLTNTSVVDVSGLSKLSNLKSLDLTNAKLLDVSTLSELKSLESLDLSWTNIDDVSALATLTNLKSLSLTWTNVVDVAGLQILTNLKSLDLSYTNVVDVSTLATLTSLKSLTLRGTKVDVSGLKKRLPFPMNFKLQVIY